jgi:TatD DNase family protein
MTGLIDIGVNFHSSQLKGLAGELLQRAKEAGVSNVLATGTSLASSKQAVALTKQHDSVRATAGVHPHTAKDYDADTHAALQVLWVLPEVVAVGECGLDYNRMFSTKEAQRHAFEQQLRAAVEHRKPLFLHCRDAFDDFHAMLKDAAAQGVHGVVHCFTDGAKEAEAYLELGFDIGVTGWVTDLARGQALRDAVKTIPLERLHLETDAPYLRPRNAKKTRPYNEPALLPYVAQEIAALKKVSVDEVVRVTQKNSRDLFLLD